MITGTETTRVFGGTAASLARSYPQNKEKYGEKISREA